MVVYSCIVIPSSTSRIYHNIFVPCAAAFCLYLSHCVATTTYRAPYTFSLHMHAVFLYFLVCLPCLLHSFHAAVAACSPCLPSPTMPLRLTCYFPSPHTCLPTTLIPACSVTPCLAIHGRPYKTLPYVLSCLLPCKPPTTPTTFPRLPLQLAYTCHLCLPACCSSLPTYLPPYLPLLQAA